MTRWPPVLRNAASAVPTRPDEPGHRHGGRRQALLGGPRVRGEIVGQLAVPVGEHGA